MANDKLLSNYGFVDPANTEPTSFKIEVDLSTVPLSHIINEMKRTHLVASAVPSSKLLAFFRTAFYDDANNVDFLKEQMRAVGRDEAIAPISVHNELSVMIELIKACHLRLE